jgi:hypothetical protein
MITFSTKPIMTFLQWLLALLLAISGHGATFALVDTLGAATPTSQFQLAGSGGQALSSYQQVGPMFVVEHPTVITEIGVFVTYCELLYGDTECPSTQPIVVRIRPALNGQPDLTRVIGTYIFPDPQHPQVNSYEAVHPNIGLKPGTYFAIFGVQGDGSANVLSSASDPFAYQAKMTPVGFVFDDGRTGTSELSLAVRILGKHGFGAGRR